MNTLYIYYIYIYNNILYIKLIDRKKGQKIVMVIIILNLSHNYDLPKQDFISYVAEMALHIFLIH